MGGEEQDKANNQRGGAAAYCNNQSTTNQGESKGSKGKAGSTPKQRQRTYSHNVGGQTTTKTRWEQTNGTWRMMVCTELEQGRTAQTTRKKDHMS